jgi:hypothetical protein
LRLKLHHRNAGTLPATETMMQAPVHLEQLRERTGIEETLGTADAAALIGYCPQSLRRWACDGTGPIRPRRVNGRLRWAVTDLRKLMSGEAA